MRNPPTAEQIKAAAREEFRGLLAIHPDQADAVASGDISPRAGWDDDDEEHSPPYHRRGNVAIVSIRGALSQRGGWWWDGHEAIRNRIERAIVDPSVSAIALEINSPGGVVAGCWDAVQAVQRALTTSRKPCLAYAREHAYSAAYAWAMVADDVYLPEAGGVGSIGVLMVLADYSKALNEGGVRIVVVRSGQRKARGMPYEGLDEDTIAAEQSRVDRLASQFFELVQDSRGLPAATIRDLEGDTFDGSIAVEKDLADGVLSWDAFLEKAEQAGKRYRMKSVSTALGLREDATEGDIMGAVKALQDKAATLDACADKLGEVATAHALRTGRITAGEVDAQRALIRKAPVDATAALMARTEMAALPAQSVESKPSNAGAGPAKPNEWAAFEAMNDQQLGAWYGSIVANPAAVQYLATHNPNLYRRASSAFGMVS